MAPPPGKKRANEPEPRPIIVKKIIAEGHGGHHGGAWKVAYADFVTAMMAFFLLMWLLGATTEKQRKGLADYFTPTLVQMKMDSAGSSGLFGGDSLTSKENYPTTGGQGNLAITIPRDATGTRDVGGDQMKDTERNDAAAKSADRQNFDRLKKQIEASLEQKALRKLRRHIKFTETREGMRIDLIDEADFAMFKMGTDALLPEARELIGQVAKVVSGVSNDIIVRGHTDGLPYSAGQTMNNWLLSSARAESTRALLAQDGISPSRFMRIEGVADREPFVPGDRYDPRNRRMSVILAWTKGLEKQMGQTIKSDDDKGDPVTEASVKRRIAMRDSKGDRLKKELRKLDLGKTALPLGAHVVNEQDIPKRNGLTPPGRTEATTHIPQAKH
ncbi:MAG: OmpA family protein [Sphingobium sp.]|nr:OmpA family protein [Sphingobium sp.]